MLSFLPELLALPLYPVLLWQGKRTRRVTPRLPEAAGPDRGSAMPAGAPASHFGRLSLLCFGESPVAGVGVDKHEEAISGQLAQALAEAYQCRVDWRAIGSNGADLAQALQQLVPRLPPAGSVDVMLIAFGVNDTTAFRPVARFRRELLELLAQVGAKLAPRLILLSGVPPVHRFPALPQPLRAVLGLKARALDAVIRQVAQAAPGVRYMAMDMDSSDPALMASDGYHPSQRGVSLWAKHLLVQAGDSFVQLAPKK